jgi:predicted AAA+ superfamily ATPase
VNDALDLGYDLFYWRTADGLEIDFILYGERGLHAIEVKRSSRVRADDLWALRAFHDDHRVARPHLVYTGTKRITEDGIDVVPIAQFLPHLLDIL